MTDGRVKKILAIATAIICLTILTGAQLPTTGPTPQAKPGEQQENPAEIEAAPKPQPKPDPAQAGPALPTVPADKADAQPEKQGPKLPSQQTLEEQHLTIA